MVDAAQRAPSTRRREHLDDREDGHDHFRAARWPRVHSCRHDRGGTSVVGRLRRRFAGPAAVPGSRFDRRGLRHGRPSRARLTVVTAGGATVGSGSGGQARQPDRAQPGGRARLPLRGRHGVGHAPHGGLLGPLDVLDAEPSFYSGQHLHSGLNYVRMRDGILLAATVRLPPGKTLADGPFPTVIEYSGYNVAGPHSLIDALEGHASSSDPLLPDTSTVVGSVVAPLLGFVTVSVQMRGTGCSGRRLRPVRPALGLRRLRRHPDRRRAALGPAPQGRHGRDLLLGVLPARGGRARTRRTWPPSRRSAPPTTCTRPATRAASTTTGSPPAGSPSASSDAQPAPRGGQPWATAEIATGDTTCLANQRLHLQAQSLESLVSPNLGRTPALFTQRSPAAWASHITVPVFLVGALEDEQVGPQWPALITALHGDKHVYVTMMNGTHTDSLGPDTISRWLEFLDLYVAGHVPTASPTLDALAPTLYSGLTGGAASAPVPRRPLHDGALGRRGQGRLRRPGPAGPGALRQRRRQPGARGPAAHLRRRVHVVAPGRHRGALRASVPTARSGTGPLAEHLDRLLPPRPVRPPGRRPARLGQRLGRPAALRLDHRPGRQRHRLRDTRLRQRDHGRRAGQPRSDAAVDGARHRSPGHRHRGPAGRDPGGVRDLGLPAQQ